MLLVVDTNILVSGLKSSNNRARSVLLIEDILSGKHEMCVSSPIMEEYEDVLYRKSLGIEKRDADWLLSWIRLNAIWIEPKPTTQNEVKMRDEDDRIFFDLAKCLRIKLVTRNYKDYPVHELITLIEELYP